ncbi:hypothetical protein [Paractinoplanes durhamensis]|uniref:hypothetical protein n=1 Tax=Paractinoplanes durhamensis TaxID=113563 RepID=UPI0031E1FEA9
MELRSWDLLGNESILEYPITVDDATDLKAAYQFKINTKKYCVRTTGRATSP